MDKHHLELERRERFNRAEWTIQRIGWAAGALLIGAGLAGLVGAGPFSSREAVAPDGAVRVEYDRFLHYHAPTTLSVTIDAAQVNSQRIRLRLSQEYLDSVEVHRIQPEPALSSVGQEGVLLTFERESGAKEAKITLHVEHQNLGSVSGEIGVEGHEGVVFHQFVYP
jgi:hypothetical protein